MPYSNTNGAMSHEDDDDDDSIHGSGDCPIYHAMLTVQDHRISLVLSMLDDLQAHPIGPLALTSIQVDSSGYKIYFEADYAVLFELCRRFRGIGDNIPDWKVYIIFNKSVC